MPHFKYGFIQRRWLLDRPSAQEFTKYIWQLSPSPALVSALAGVGVVVTIVVVAVIVIAELEVEFTTIGV